MNKMKTLIKVYDDKEYLNNVMIPLSLSFDMVVFIYREEIKDKLKKATIDLLNKYKCKTIFRKIVNDEEIEEILEKYQGASIDISSNRYLTFYLFEQITEEDNEILYYDIYENVIKDYRSHEIIKKELHHLTIEEIVSLGGGEYTCNMHDVPDLNNKFEVNAVKKVVEKSIDNYSSFTNFISMVMKIIAKENNLSIHINQEEKHKLLNNQNYKLLQECKIITIKENKLIIANHFFLKMLKNAGAWLECYIYITLMQSGRFEEVAMSAVIDFRSRGDFYPVSCEIDLITIKNNRLLFISCKSNKVDTEAINEIKVHNLSFGNTISKSAICTIEDLNINNPAIYKKAEEHEVAIVDYTSFKNKIKNKGVGLIEGKNLKDNTLVDIVDKIIENKYEYEKVVYN